LSTMANVDASVAAAYQEVRNGGANWFVLGYEGNKIKVQQTGTGGIDELVNSLSDEEAQYGYIKFQVTVEETTRTKFVLISWVGDNTPPMKKGKVSTDKPVLKTIVKDFAIEVAASEKGDLTEAAVLNKLRSANY